MSVLDENVAIFKYFEEISKIPHNVIKLRQFLNL